MAPPYQRDEGPIRPFRNFLHGEQLSVVADELCGGNPSSFPPLNVVKAYLSEPGRLDDILYTIYAPRKPLIDSDTVLSKYVAVLCILLEIEKAAFINDFVEQELNDDKLPFDPLHEPSEFPQAPKGDYFYEKFCEEQWRFAIPVFKRWMNRQFKKNHILPIANKEVISDRGGSATLYKVTLHGAYNQLHPRLARIDPKLQNIFALKTYSTAEAAKDYENEVNGFRTIGRPADANEHLIGFYGNYTHNGTFNLILEFADEGSLEDYFATHPPPREAHDIQQFWTSLLGLINALKSIHENDGLHQDVNTANILVCSGGSDSPYNFKFKLSDLGLIAFTESTNGLRPGTAPSSSGTLTYGAPESFSEDEFWDTKLLHIDRRADIWSLGCVLSEAAVWMGKGYQKLLQYRTARKQEAIAISPRLGDCFHDSQNPLATVLLWHDSLPDSLCRGDVYTPGVLRVITDFMLHGDHEKRLDTKQLWHQASRVLDGNYINTSPGPNPGFGTDTSAPNRQSTLSYSFAPPRPRYNPSVINISPSKEVKTFPNLDRFSSSSSSTIPRVDSPDNYSVRGDEQAAGIPRYPPSSPSGHASGSPLVSPRKHVSYRDSMIGNQRQSTMQETYPVYANANKSSLYQPRPLSNDIPNEIIHEFGGHHQGPPISSYHPSTWEPHEIQHHPVDKSYVSGNQSPYPGQKPQAQLHPSIPEPDSPPLQHERSPPPKPKAKARRRKRVPIDLPHLTPVEAYKWKNDLKEYFKKQRNPLSWTKLRGGSTPGPPKIKGHNWLPKLQKRDHVFILDDAHSMWKHWDEMCELFGILAYIVKKTDDDGIDMYFGRGAKRYNNKDTSKLIDVAKKRKLDLGEKSSISVRLESILGSYNSDLQNENDSRIGASPDSTGDKSPLSVYVFTNGDWSVRTDLIAAIEKVVDSLVKLKAPDSQVGIQFISFGDNAQNLALLDHFDSGLGFKLDIVDHTQSNGNLWKMLLGAIDRGVDDSSSDEEIEGISKLHE